MNTKTNKLLAGYGVAALLAFASFGGASSAASVYSFEGSDYSWNASSTSLKACDQESDSTPVKGEYDYDQSGGGSGSVKDSDGANGICASRTGLNIIKRHKTCEYRTAWPDACGNWQSTGA